MISTLSSSAKIISDIFEAKIRIAEPLLENTERILDSLNDTKTIERNLVMIDSMKKSVPYASFRATNYLSPT